MKSFVNLLGFSDSKLGYRKAKEQLEFIDGQIVSKERVHIFSRTWSEYKRDLELNG